MLHTYKTSGNPLKTNSLLTTTMLNSCWLPAQTSDVENLPRNLLSLFPGSEEYARNSPCRSQLAADSRDDFKLRRIYCSTWAQQNLRCVLKSLQFFAWYVTSSITIIARRGVDTRCLRSSSYLAGSPSIIRKLL